MRLAAFTLSLLMLTGCTFHSTQLESIVRLVSPTVDTMKDYRWVLELDGNAYSVYAVASDPGVIFTNERGLYLTFDGWSFRTLGGFGKDAINGLNEVIDYDTIRVIRNRYDSLELRCAAWSHSVDANGTQSGYQQECSTETGEIFRNSIQLSAQGAITEIEQVVTPNGDTATIYLLTTQ